MKIGNIGIDIDGVLTDIESFQLKFGESFFKNKYNKDIVNRNGYTIKEIFDCTKEQEKEFWTKYLLQYSISTKAREGASAFTNKVHNQGGKIYIITSRYYTDKDNSLGKIMRFIVEEWLKANNIYYDQIIFCSDDKTDAIKNNNIEIMFEDSAKNINDLKDLTSIVCVDANYNKSVTDVYRINSFDEHTFDLVVDIINNNEYKKIEDRHINEIKPISGKGSIDKPWMKYYSYEERNIELPKMKIYDYLYKNNQSNLNRVAINYFDNKITYKELFQKIDAFATSFVNLGVKNGDIVTLCLPNVPEAVYAFYGLNKIGAVANMIHPMKSGNEIKECINLVNSKIMVMIDNSYNEINKIIDQTNIEKAIVVSAGDSMPFLMSGFYKSKCETKIDYKDKYISLKYFLRQDVKRNIDSKYEENKTAVIIYTGGTSGTPKGVELTNDNFNCMVHEQKATAKNFSSGDKMLTIMPVFHGFGLCSSIHMPLSYGITTILIPKFESKNFHNLIKKYKPNHIFGVPKLWKALISDKEIQKMDLSFMKYIVSGGENMKDGLEDEINNFLKEHNCYSKVKKGYGLSEAVAGTTLSDDYCNLVGSVGIPLICNSFKVVKPGTQEEVNYNEEGEFCISGPTVMKQYYNNVSETNMTIQKHKDGKIWLHTGDMGLMTEDGILYYTDRLTRMYVTGGFNVYPPRIEKVIESNKLVEACAVVPMNHPYKDVKVPKVYVIMKDGVELNDQIITEIMNTCKENLDLHHQPFKFAEIDEFPTTKLGKTDYKALEKMAEQDDIKVKVKRR